MVTPRKFHVLIIDDEKDTNKVFEMAMEELWDVTTFDSAQPLIKKPALLHDYDAIVLDLVFNRDQSFLERITTAPNPIHGLAILDWIRLRNSEIPVFINTAVPKFKIFSDPEKKFKNTYYIEKPIVFDEHFKNMVEGAIISQGQKH